MPKGWTVIVRRRPRRTDLELWDCAIPNAQAAEKAVRNVCDSQREPLITAHTRLTEFEVHELGLKAGQVRKRPGQG
jgi:hypothetical protein